MQLDMPDLLAAIERLEADPLVSSWSLTRITNEVHSLAPLGKGISVEVSHALSQRVWPGVSTLRVWEKAGVGRPLTEAVTVALRRLAKAVEDRAGAPHD